MAIGPLQLVVIGYEGDVLDSGVLDELHAASDAGDIKLVDVLVAEMSEEGELYTSEISDLTYEEEIRFGALLGGLIGLGAGGPEGMQAGAEAGAEIVADTHSVFGLTPFEVNDIIFTIPRGHSALIALFEHSWAVNLRQASLDAGGVMLAQAMIDPRGLVTLGAELAAVEEAIEVIEAAKALEEEAVIEAAEAVVISEAIQQEAARRAVDALLAAEIIEEAAIEQATEAVIAALEIEDAARERSEEEN
jgi:uncharacterized membrane protein